MSTQRELRKVVIIGAGGFARETLDVFDAVNAITPTYDVMGYIVDPQYEKPGTIINDKPILGDFSWLQAHPDVYAICAVGAPALRFKLIKQAREMQASFCTVVHPTAVLTRWVTLGEGTIITAGCILTNQIRVGNHVHINLDCTIGHDTIISDFTTLSPGTHVSGNVSFGEGCFVGTGANILEKKQIGAWSVIGAGSTVVKDVPANTTVVGVPAQVIKERPEGWHLV
ncbi:MAG: acetyltransferase [Anaerolineales bacterium]|nr:acetyltransferase [Anaerolineales bacterium]